MLAALRAAAVGTGADKIAWVDAAAAKRAPDGGVGVPGDILRDLNKAGVVAAPPGKQLALAPLNTSLKAAGFDNHRIMEIKRVLVSVGQIDERLRV
jgi:hypothetical protein